MDSDDDYNSGMSSQEDGFEEELQESGDDSMEEGVSLLTYFPEMMLTLLNHRL